MEPEIIKIAHFRYTPSGSLTNRRRDVQRYGGYTVVHVVYENQIFVGISRCRKSDIFSKKIGVDIAYYRALGAIGHEDDPRIPSTIEQYMRRTLSYDIPARG